MNQHSDKLLPAVYGGVIMALVSTIPFVSFINCLCCAGVLLGGFLAVFFYKNNRPPDAPPLIAGDCMLVGLFAGFIGAILGAILSTIFLQLFGNVAGEILRSMIADLNLNIPQETLRTLEESTTDSPTVATFFIQLVTNLVVYDIFGLLGGLIGYSIFKQRGLTPMPPPPAAPTAV